MGNKNGKAIRQLEEANCRNQAMLEQIRQKNAYEAQLAAERASGAQAVMDQQLRFEAQKNAAAQRELEIQQSKNESAKRAVEEITRQMEKQADLNREQNAKIQAINQDMLRRQEESNQRQIQNLLAHHMEQRDAAQTEYANQQIEQQKQHRESIVTLTKQSQQQIDAQAKMYKNTLETHIEHTEKTSRMQHDENRRRDQMLQDTLEAERERSAKLLESHNQLIQQFLSAQEKFQEYVSKPPEKPIYKEENIREAIVKARLMIGLNDREFYNFAFAGHTKAGKSSLINAIRGIGPKDHGAAAVDFTECTHEISYYSFPDGQFPFVRLYDLPGSGTLSHNSETYYSDKGLCAFDCLIIMVQSTLCQEDITFALQALKYNQPVAFVRSRCDVDMNNAVNDELIEEVNQETINEYLANIAQKYKEQIDKSGEEGLKKVPCYFVSSISMRKLMTGKTDLFYQEGKLMEYVTLQSKHSRNIV